MEFVATGWCTRKWLRFDLTIRDLTCGDLEISFVVIRLGVAGPHTSWTGGKGGGGGRSGAI